MRGSRILAGERQVQRPRGTQSYVTAIARKLGDFGQATYLSETPYPLHSQWLCCHQP